MRPSQFILELAETRLMENLTVSLEILTRLRLEGFGLDRRLVLVFHYGELEQLPFTEVKIDRAFVKRARYRTKPRERFSIPVQLGKIFHLNLVAEGVETQQVGISSRGIRLRRSSRLFRCSALACRPIY